MNSIVVLTTHERADWFRAALGEDADFYFDCDKTKPLHDFLANAKLAGGTAVILDEDHFPSAGEMLLGLESYLNDGCRNSKGIRIIVVCPRRTAEDDLLLRLAGYCHIYDLLYDVDGVDLVDPLREMLKAPHSRVDVLPLLDNQAGFSLQRLLDGIEREAEDAAGVAPDNLASAQPAGIKQFLRPGRRIHLEVLVR